MKVIGLIGGMSWSSSLEYYRLINELVSCKLGGLHSARLVLYNLDFEEIELAQRESHWEDAADILIKAAIALKQAGADFLLICTRLRMRWVNQLDYQYFILSMQLAMPSESRA